MNSKKNTGGAKKARKPTEATIPGLEVAREPSSEEIKLAKKHGYRTPKPSKKGVEATVSSVNAWTKKYNRWADHVRKHAAKQLDKEAQARNGKAAKATIGKL